MAAPSNKGGKRISSLFSLGGSKDDSSASLSQSTASSSHLRISSHDYPLTSSSASASIRRSRSAQNLVPHEPHPTALQADDTSEPVILNPPRTLKGTRPARSAVVYANGSHPASREGSRSRPTTPNLPTPLNTTSSPGSLSRPGTPNSAKQSKRRSWFPGKTDRVAANHPQNEPQAWIAGLREHIPYDLKPLLTGQKVRASPSTPRRLGSSG